MNFIFQYGFLGALAGVLFYITRSIESGSPSTVEYLIQWVGMGALGGLLPGIAHQASRRFIPILQSWVMIVVIVFGIQLFHAKTQSLLWTAFLYGYLAHLLWEGYHKNLPKV